MGFFPRRRLLRLTLFLVSLAAVHTLLSYLLPTSARHSLPHIDFPTTDITNVRPFTDPVPLISLILFFNGTTLPKSAAYFLKSVGRQEGVVELLFVQRGDCTDMSEWTGGMTNIKHICTSEEQFWGAHRDYFCERWGGCTRSQSQTMINDMIAFGKLKRPEWSYPILRGWVFRHWLNPNTVWWGYCDLDIFIGDFTQTFPYDLAASDYDIILPTEPSNQGGNRLIFMRGHMSFFRNTRETEDKLMSYEHFANFKAWDEMPLAGTTVGEGEFSHFVVGHPSINILLFDGMAPAPLISSFSPAGIITHSDSLRPRQGQVPKPSQSFLKQLMVPATRLPRRASFTEDGLEFSVAVHQGMAPPGYGLWFNESLCSWYDAQPNPPSRTTPQRWKRYMTKIDNVWTERLEPWYPFKGNDEHETGLLEAYQWLYVHWQTEKRQSHFTKIPSSPLPDIFLSYWYDGNGAFDGETGEMLWWLENKKESCSIFGCVPFGEGPSPTKFNTTEEQQASAALELYPSWYQESKAIRLGRKTGTLGPNPLGEAKPTHTPAFWRGRD